VLHPYIVTYHILRLPLFIELLRIKLTTENSELKSKVKILDSKIQVLESEKQALITENENLRKKIQDYDHLHHGFENPPEDYDPLTFGLKK